MPYLGNDPGAITDAFTDTFTGDASETNFTLTRASTTNSVFVRVHGVMQRNGTDFTVDGTTLTFTTAPPNASNNIVVQFFTVGSVQVVADNAITQAKMADNAIGLAELAGGTDGNLITFDASGDPAFVATGSSGQVLTSAGAGSPPTFAKAINIGSPTATTSGTTIDISIPSGTRAIWVSYDAVSPAGSGEIALRLGDGGGVETSGYISYLGSYRASGNTSMDSSTTMWKLVEQASASCIWYGTVQLFLQNASTNNWVFSSAHNTSAGTTQTNVSSGQKALSAELTTLQLLTTSGDYDAGAVNIVYI
jgi:hypothetical protein